MAEESEKPLRKRPIGVWLIVGFFILSALLSIYSIVHVVIEKAEIFAQLPLGQLIVSYTLVVVNFIGAIYLFRLKVIALWIFIGTFVVSLLFSIVFKITGHQLPDIENGAPDTQMFQLLFWVAIIIYVASLKKKEIIK